MSLRAILLAPPPASRCIGRVVSAGRAETGAPSATCRKTDKVLMKQAIIAADEWARINLYQRQIGIEQGVLSREHRR